MLISIDHGNKQIKTASKTFTSAFTESDTKPPFGEDILEYQGKYYSLSGNRIPYLRNKAIDDRFFILTLFALAYEIEAIRVYNPDEIMDVQLAVGLPPAHFGAQAEQFEAYFKNRDVISFVFQNKPYDIYINEVICFPQTYAASVPLFGKLKDIPKVVVVDIGGFTADYLLLRNGKGELSVCDSLKNGVIVLYNRIQSKVNADLDLLLEERLPEPPAQPPAKQQGTQKKLRKSEDIRLEDAEAILGEDGMAAIADTLSAFRGK